MKKIHTYFQGRFLDIVMQNSHCITKPKTTNPTLSVDNFFQDTFYLAACDHDSSPLQTAAYIGRFTAFEWMLPLEFLQSAGLLQKHHGWWHCLPICTQ